MIGSSLSKCCQQCDEMFMDSTIESAKCFDFFRKFLEVLLLELFDGEESSGNIDLGKLNTRLGRESVCRITHSFESIVESVAHGMNPDSIYRPKTSRHGRHWYEILS